MGITKDQLKQMFIDSNQTAQSNTITKDQLKQEFLRSSGAVESPTGERTQLGNEHPYLADALIAPGSGIVRGAAGALDLAINAPEAVYKQMTGEAPRASDVWNELTKEGPVTKYIREENPMNLGTVAGYEPRTTPGKYVKTTGEFAAGALGGEGSLVKKGLEVVAPAVASEAAGQAAEGSKWEGPVRIASAIAAAIGLGGSRALTGKDRAAEEFSKMATDPRAAAAKIGSEAETPRLGENIPGSVPDTAEITGDVGLAHGRKRMLMDPEFNQAVGENQAAQNAARQRHLDTVVPEADTMALQDQLTAKRNVAEQAAATAEADAAAKAALVPAARHPEELGTNLRASIAAAKETAKEAVNQAFAKVDPGRKVIMVAAPIKAAAKRAVADFAPGMSAPFGSGEARVLDAINGAPETMPFWHMKALRENVNSAIDDSLGEFGKATPETRRLQIIKTGIDDAISNAQHHQANYVPTVGYNGPAPNLNPSTYRDLGIANKLYADYSDQFVSGPVGHALQPLGNDFKNSNASVTKNAFAAGPEGFERTSKFLGTTPDSLAHIKEMAISKFQELAGDKPITPEMVQKWRSKYDGSIRAIEAHDPTFADTIREAAGSQSTAADLKTQARAQTVLNVHGADDMRNHVGKALSGGRGKVKELMDLAAGDQDAIAGIKRAGIEHMVEKFSNAGSLGGEKILSGAKLGKFVSANSDAIKELIGQDGLDSLKAISSDIERSQVAIENARTRTVGSDTAYMLGQDIKDIKGKIGSGIKGIANTAAGVGVGYTHPIVGFGLSGVHFMGSLVEKLGAAKTKQLMKEALLDPKKAKELLELHAQKTRTIPPWLRTLIVSTSSAGAESRTGRASGGSVRIDHEAEADKLIKEAEASKQRHSQTTEPLLNAPDEHIVKALSIAKEAI